MRVGKAEFAAPWLDGARECCRIGLRGQGATAQVSAYGWHRIKQTFYVLHALLRPTHPDEAGTAASGASRAGAPCARSRRPAWRSTCTATSAPARPRSPAPCCMARRGATCAARHKSPTYHWPNPTASPAGVASRSSVDFITSTCTGLPARKNSSTPDFANISNDTICIVEWPEKASGRVAAARHKCSKHPARS